MTDIHSLLSTYSRPKILLRTARAGVATYRRTTHLKQIGINPALYGDILMQRLLDAELEQETARKARDVAYRAHRHVALWTAILAEAGRPVEYKMAA